jgi:hypothetical protein
VGLPGEEGEKWMLYVFDSWGRIDFSCVVEFVVVVEVEGARGTGVWWLFMPLYGIMVLL